MALTNPIRAGTSADAGSIIQEWYNNYQSTMNAGIMFGMNQYPLNNSGFAPYMGGPTTGITTIGTLANTGDIISAANFTNFFTSVVQQYGAIRTATFQYIITGAGVVGQDIGVAYLTATYQGTVPTIPGPTAGDLVSSSALASYFSNLVSTYLGYRAQSVGTLVYEICHSSCHSSCHGSRGRR